MVASYRALASDIHLFRTPTLNPSEQLNRYDTGARISRGRHVQNATYDLSLYRAAAWFAADKRKDKNCRVALIKK